MGPAVFVEKGDSKTDFNIFIIATSKLYDVKTLI